MRITKRDLKILIENFLYEQEEEGEDTEVDAEEEGEDAEGEAEETQEPAESSPAVKPSTFNYIDKKNGLDLKATISITADNQGTALAVDNRSGKSINFNELAAKDPESATAGVMMIFKKAIETLKNKEKVGQLTRWNESKMTKIAKRNKDLYPTKFLELWQ